MIINKLTLSNFMCYYDTKSFEFAEGLNIILGHNGDGKSTIFTAFNWIFDQYSPLNLSEIYSKKKYSEILENESFDVFVECTVTQFNKEYKIKKLFTVNKYLNDLNISFIREEIILKDLTTGSKSICNETISELTKQVFPEAFRNFSMFETETDALKIVEGKQLADLIKNFSNAKHYEFLDKLMQKLAKKADSHFRRASKADKTTQDAITKIDEEINEIESKLERLKKNIQEDEKGRDEYSEKITELLKNLKLSENYEKIDKKIKKLTSEIERARGENTIRSRFTDKIFDQFYILKGFDEIVSEFSSKVNNLRTDKNKVDSEKRNKFAAEKLELENGSIPLPPGSPSLEILEEILKDEICKVCNTKLEESAIKYIEQSIKLYKESKKQVKELKIPVIFPNNFIEEFQIIAHSIQLRPLKFSKNRIEEEIEFDINRIGYNDNLINENKDTIINLEAEKKELLTNISNLSETEIKDIGLNHEKLSIEKDELVHSIGANKLKLEYQNTSLQELKNRRKNILSQYSESEFKQATVEVLSKLSEIAKIVKEVEYTKFLKDLSEKATKYLKEINEGEITGKIELYKKNDEEVNYKSLNEDNSIRSSLEDSGALQISKPLSILFAIADIASQTADNEPYPMIFDAPTGRFSPDREQKFFKVLKHQNKQRIVVTLRFLGVDEDKKPFVKNNLFQNIEKDKAFFVKRIRPFDENKPETINTEIEILP